jgi:hypothetical protein
VSRFWTYDRCFKDIDVCTFRGSVTDRSVFCGLFPSFEQDSPESHSTCAFLNNPSNFNAAVVPKKGKIPQNQYHSYFPLGNDQDVGQRRKWYYHLPSTAVTLIGLVHEQMYPSTAQIYLVYAQVLSDLAN